MSRTLVQLFSEYDDLHIECQDDAPVVWVRGDESSVALNLSAFDRAKLRAALVEADRRESDQWPFSDNTGMP